MCDNQVEVFISMFRSITYICGQFGHKGTVILCPICEEANKKAYPQGWRESPGDVCKHGTYIGPRGSVEYLCGYCED